MGNGGHPTRPWGIAVDASGNIWTANSAEIGVSKLSSLGEVLSPTFGGFPLSPFSTSYSGSPLKIAIDSSGNAWVVSANADSFGGVFELSPSGTPCQEMGASPAAG
jgi:DNA-binding beta-propeller fold protein YncE